MNITPRLSTSLSKAKTGMGETMVVADIPGFAALSPGLEMLKRVR
jgi:hypothetical protein